MIYKGLKMINLSILNEQTTLVLKLVGWVDLTSVRSVVCAVVDGLTLNPIVFPKTDYNTFDGKTSWIW